MFKVMRKRSRSGSLDRWKFDKRSKKILKLAFDVKKDDEKWNRHEKMEISNVTMNKYDSIVKGEYNRDYYSKLHSTSMDVDPPSTSTLQRLLNSKMGCERENHSAEDYISTCKFTCKKCNLKFHEKCLKASAKKMKFDSYDVSRGICVICAHKEKVFAREAYVHWADIDLEAFKTS